jgi:solute carrier family 9 (sodium/hydrogen exchanger), member 8
VNVQVLLCVLGSLLLERLNNNYWFSNNAVLAIALGFVASLPFCGQPDHIVYATFDTTLFLYLMPPILFESGYGLNHIDFFRNIVAILVLAFIGTTISCISIGGGLYLLAQQGLVTAVNSTNPREALMFGSVMAATDSVATLSVLGSLNVDSQLYNLVFGKLIPCNSHPPSTKALVSLSIPRGAPSPSRGGRSSPPPC